jgi:DNA-directed RNA polymerase subunit RPC12/RpoP
MAAMISFTCPECKTALKGPADMQGKKARCKRCSHIFVLKANSPADASPAAPAARGKTSRPATPAAKTSPAKPAAKKPATPEPEAEPMTYMFREETEALAEGAGGAKSTTPSPHGSQNPYGVTDLDLAPRCPFCAQEMESEDAIICLHCGYNTQTRSHPVVKRTYANTGGEIFMWLLPGIGCVVGILALIGFICYLWLQLDPKHYFTQPAQIWGSIISGGIIFFLARFAIKRLILHPTPPEMEKK